VNFEKSERWEKLTVSTSNFVRLKNSHRRTFQIYHFENAGSALFQGVSELRFSLHLQLRSNSQRPYNLIILALLPMLQKSHGLGNNLDLPTTNR
jgi:hypothetical protein